MWVIFLFLFGNSVHAAQQAIVTGKDTQVRVYAEPNVSSSVLQEIAPGTRLLVSSKTKEGWHRVILPGKRLGWIRSDDILSATRLEALKSSRIQISEPVDSVSNAIWFLIGVQYRPSLLIAAGNEQTAASVSSQMGFAQGFGGYFGVRLHPRWNLKLLFDYLLYSQALGAQSLSLSTMAPGARIEGIFWERLPWKSSFSLSGGVLLASQMNTASQSLTAALTPWAAADLQLSFYFSSHFSFFLALGYQYALPASFGLGNATTGAWNAPYGRTGFQIEF